MTKSLVMADRTRVRKDMESISQFGKLENVGVTRLALTKEDMDARDYLKTKMKEAGLTISEDAVGNVYGRREGKKDLAPILIGSHLDTVPEGGHYDGIAGVVTALEAVRLLNDQGLE